MKGSGSAETIFHLFKTDIPEALFPREGMSARAAQALVHAETFADASPVLNLSSFVTSFIEMEALDLARQHFCRNLADEAAYPRSSAIEKRIVRWLHELWNGGPEADPYGFATIGSSEACLIAGLSLKLSWRERRHRRGQALSRPNIVSGNNAHGIWRKFAFYFDVELRLSPLRPGKYCISGSDLRDLVDENTIGVVATVGTTLTGEDDDVQSLSDWLDEYERRSGHAVPIHVDAASGGFVHPFLYPDDPWDFRVPRVVSINASGHKYGLVPPSIGWAVWRDRRQFHRDLMLFEDQAWSKWPAATLNNSRSAVQILLQYYMILRLGFEGYRGIMQTTLDHAHLLHHLLLRSGLFQLLNEAQRLPMLTLALKPTITAYTVFDIANKVREKGWTISAFTMPDASHEEVLRIIVRPYMTQTMIEELARDILAACAGLSGDGRAPRHRGGRGSFGKC